MSIRFYHITDSYIDYLSQYDSNIRENKSEARPYVGVIFQVSEINYFIPLSSPKEKHKTMKNNEDFIKINGGKYGVINLNNMIPIPESELVNFDILDEENENYRIILFNQFSFFKKNIKDIATKAKDLYNKISDFNAQQIENLSQHEQKLIKRCVHYKQAESNMLVYIKMKKDLDQNQQANTLKIETNEQVAGTEEK